MKRTVIKIGCLTFLLPDSVNAASIFNALKKAHLLDYVRQTSKDGVVYYANPHFELGIESMDDKKITCKMPGEPEELEIIPPKKAKVQRALTNKPQILLEG